jgi:hypothetical protein
LDARDCALALGPDLGTVPMSGNTSRQHATTLAVLTEPWLTVKSVGKIVWSFFGDTSYWKISPKNSTSFRLRIGLPHWGVFESALVGSAMGLLQKQLRTTNR